MRKKKKTKTWSTRMYPYTPERFVKLKESSQLQWQDFWEKLIEELESKKQGKLL